MVIRGALREALLRLSAAERRDLAEALCERLDDEPLDPAWKQAWSREVEDRLAEVVAGKVALFDADEVHAALRAELSHRGP